MKSLTIDEFKELQEGDVIVVDTRPSLLFTEGFIPGSLSLGLGDQFAEWAAQLLSNKQPILLVTEAGREEESRSRLNELKIENTAGCLEGGYEAWKAAGEEMDMIITVESDELIMDMPFDEQLIVVDVRRPAEYEEGHLKDALNLPLDEMNDIVEIANFEENQNLYIHSAGDYRAIVAASLLKQQGYHNLRHVIGGWNSISREEKAEIVKGKG